jgi:hypothetical protein
VAYPATTDDVRLHLAGYAWYPATLRLHLTSTHQSSELYELLARVRYRDGLCSYAYANVVRRFYEPWWSTLIAAADAGEDCRPRTVIDSGAFTAWSTGKAITPEEYAEWALGIRAAWQQRMAALYFLNLDVIGDQAKTWENQTRLERLGLAPLPIVTYGADTRDLHRALSDYPLIALGGLVPHARNRPRLMWWLDRCFKIVLSYADRLGHMPRIHLLGVGVWWVVSRYPVFSSDSSSWNWPVRFGHHSTKTKGLREIPEGLRLPKHGGATTHDLAAIVSALRAEVTYAKKIARDGTRLWADRGITFADESQAAAAGPATAGA